MGFTITGNETLLFITTDASKVIPIYRSPGSLAGEKTVTKCDQIWGIQKTRLCKEFVMKIRRPKADPGGLGD